MWDESFNFYRKNEFLMHIKVFDKDLITDDLIGETKFNLSDLF